MNDEQLHQALRAKLDAGLEPIDPTLEARLRAGRERAVEAIGPGHRVGRRAAFGGLAIAATVLLAVILVPQHRSTLAPASSLDDYELLSADEQIELYRDLDFYLWLQQEATTREQGMG